MRHSTLRLRLHRWSPRPFEWRTCVSSGRSAKPAVRLRQNQVRGGAGTGRANGSRVGAGDRTSSAGLRRRRAWQSGTLGQPRGARPAAAFGSCAQPAIPGQRSRLGGSAAACGISSAGAGWRLPVCRYNADLDTGADSRTGSRTWPARPSLAGARCAAATGWMDDRSGAYRWPACRVPGGRSDCGDRSAGVDAAPGPQRGADRLCGGAPSWWFAQIECGAVTSALGSKGKGRARPWPSPSRLK